MTDPRIAVIMPTIGRETLERSLATIVKCAQIVVVGDGVLVGHRVGNPWSVSGTTDIQVVARSVAEPAGDHGAAARNVGLLHLAATHVAYLDDDDAYMPNTIRLFRQWAADDPDALHIGRIIGDDGSTVIAWTERVIRKGQVATPTILAPAWAAVQVAWESVYDHDWRWARDVAALVPRVVWHKEVVAMVRPWG